jgi:hypothetical protein
MLPGVILNRNGCFASSVVLSIHTWGLDSGKS